MTLKIGTAVGSTSAQIVSVKCKLLMTIYQGIKPPLNIIMKTISHMYISLLRNSRRSFANGYAISIVNTKLMAPPSSTRFTETPNASKKRLSLNMYS
ncbi:hypothetical protein D3C78_1348850 [compost metagenome]